MIGLDTNVLLRLFDSSDAEQSAAVDAFVMAQGHGGCMVGPAVLVEFVWVLTRQYKHNRQEIAGYLVRVMDAPEFVIAFEPEVVAALDHFRYGKADFADYFSAEMYRTAGCTSTATFDANALRSSDLFTPVPMLPRA